jgi:hypothetical protein
VLGTEAEKRDWPIVLERKDNIYVLSCGSSRRFPSTDARAAAHYVIGLPCGRKK